VRVLAYTLIHGQESVVLRALTRVLSVLSVLISSMGSTYLESLIVVCREYTYSRAKPYVAYRSACMLEDALARYEVEPGLIRRVRLVLDEFYGLPTSPLKSMSEAARREAARAQCQRAALTAVCEESYSLSPTQPRVEADQVTTKASCQARIEADQVTGQARIDADQVTGQAKIEADQVTGQARIAADQVTGQARIEADQVTGQARIDEVTTERIAQLVVQHYDQMALRGAVFDASCESKLENHEVPVQPSQEDCQPGTVVAQKIRATLEAMQPTNQPSNHPTPTNPTTCDADQPTNHPTPTNPTTCDADQPTNQPTPTHQARLEADQPTNQPTPTNQASFETDQPTDQPTPTNQASLEAYQVTNQPTPTHQASLEADQPTNQPPPTHQASLDAGQPTNQEVDQDQSSSQRSETQSVAQDKQQTWSLGDHVAATLFLVVLSNALLKVLCREMYVPIVFWGQDMPMVLVYMHSALETLVVTLCEVVCNLVCSLCWSVWEPIKNAKVTYQQRVAWWTRQARHDLDDDDQEGDLDGLYY
jgi:hypothetical protein